MATAQGSVNLIQLRLIILTSIAIFCGFMGANLILLPSSLHSLYLDSRLFMQLPLCLFFFALTFAPFYSKLHSLLVCSVMLLLIYINYWFIVQCWQLASFAFPYESTIIYSLITLFVFRIRFHHAVIFSLFTLAGFLVVAMTYPVYGDKNSVNMSFVTASLLLGVIGVYQIKTALKHLYAANAQLQVLNQIDPLTNILNRSSYETRFVELLELGKRNDTIIGVFLIDLDFFKSYNDGYGHVEGDAIIKLQAMILSKVFRRTTDIVARYGGAEFVVVVANVSEEQCIEFANQLVNEWTTKQVPHGKTLGQNHVSCSIGFCLEALKLDSDTLNLAKKADKALHQAKAKGRNCFMQYADDDI